MGASTIWRKARSKSSGSSDAPISRAVSMNRSRCDFSSGGGGLRAGIDRTPSDYGSSGSGLDPTKIVADGGSLHITAPKLLLMTTPDVPADGAARRSLNWSSHPLNAMTKSESRPVTWTPNAKGFIATLVSVLSRISHPAPLSNEIIWAPKRAPSASPAYETTSTIRFCALARLSISGDNTPASRGAAAASSFAARSIAALARSFASPAALFASLAWRCALAISSAAADWYAPSSRSLLALEIPEYLHTATLRAAATPTAIKYPIFAQCKTVSTEYPNMAPSWLFIAFCLWMYLISYTGFLGYSSCAQEEKLP